MATLKKLRFKKARDLRAHGLDFSLARKLANDLVRNGRVTRQDLPEVEHFMWTCGDRCCSFFGVVVQTKYGPLKFTDDFSRQLA